MDSQTWLTRLQALQNKQVPKPLGVDVKSRLDSGANVSELWKQMQELLGEGSAAEVARQGWIWQRRAAEHTFALPRVQAVDSAIGGHSFDVRPEAFDGPRFPGEESGWHASQPDAAGVEPRILAKVFLANADGGHWYDQADTADTCNPSGGIFGAHGKENSMASAISSATTASYKSGASNESVVLRAAHASQIRAKRRQEQLEKTYSTAGGAFLPHAYYGAPALDPATGKRLRFC